MVEQTVSVQTLSPVYDFHLTECSMVTLIYVFVLAMQCTFVHLCVQNVKQTKYLNIN